MKRGVVFLSILIAAVTVVLTSPTAAVQTAQQPVRTPDIHWVPTPDPVVDGMLKLAKVTKTDVVYDLGCGDGKIVIAAARLGARGVGIDIDPQRVAEATANVRKAGVQDKVEIRLGDIFDPAVKISDASVVTLYLLSTLNEKLMPRLKAELRPGTRIVSHAFKMGDWEPEQTEQINGINIFFWTIPKR
jgi:cyclopropane fatty-acyl-phospholipid synthase-like methyltransferase